ncbi:nuclear transport factor 2 family protein [Marinilongibacter aquaticus]|uniref:nuclear transport factor 2 family protein n=1 Tax=Marinilongibacter aquaticus TaxID=2975157 RepID=UPI0021BD49CE|nr:nuclear transport factor 2 family protein [Marinilongibacter aquaticus]UBM59431.1 nuclear transport factor 2 family protein [Marinilongibacter aquaticus]
MKNIENFFTAYKNAVWQKDTIGLLALYGPEVLAFDMWDKSHFNDLQEWKPEIEGWLNALGDEQVKVDFECVKIHESENLGFASGFILFQAVSPEGEALRGMKNRISLGFAKSENEWKVVHQHISAPISSENLSAILDL